MRLDKYLKVSRIIKRRTVANEACSGGRVTLNGKVAKPGAEVKPGDIMTIRFGDHLGRYEILAVPGVRCARKVLRKSTVCWKRMRRWRPNAARRNKIMWGSIILGGGSGQRMGAKCNKVLLPIAGKSMIVRSVEAFVPLVEQVVVVSREEDMPAMASELAQNGLDVPMVSGGATRQESVWRGLARRSLGNATAYWCMTARAVW